MDTHSSWAGVLNQDVLATYQCLDKKIRVNQNLMRRVVRLYVSAALHGSGRRLRSRTALKLSNEVVYIVLRSYALSVIDYLAKQWQIKKAICSLPANDSRWILELRYICGMKWEDIAQEVHYSLQHVHRLHKQAIELYAK